VLTTAYTLAAPYSLPWYALLTWATLPLIAASILDQALLVHLLVMALAYVPGRVVGMTPGVERVTLWVRRTLAPYAVLLVWVWLTLAALRESRQSASPRPPAPSR
jgi:cytochrome b subunit of formate dehydrogenase